MRPQTNNRLLTDQQPTAGRLPAQVRRLPSRADQEGGGKLPVLLRAALYRRRAHAGLLSAGNRKKRGNRPESVKSTISSLFQKKLEAATPCAALFCHALPCAAMRRGCAEYALPCAYARSTPCGHSCGHSLTHAVTLSLCHRRACASPTTTYSTECSECPLQGPHDTTNNNRLTDQQPTSNRQTTDAC
jgi:hypothetical protein